MLVGWVVVIRSMLLLCSRIGYLNPAHPDVASLTIVALPAELVSKFSHKFELLSCFPSQALRNLEMPFFLKDPVGL